MIDIDGVISLFGGGEAGIDPYTRPEGIFRSIDGIPHFLSATAAAHLLTLAADFDLVWCSGWEEKAEEYLPHLLGLPAGLPFLRFERGQGAGNSLHGHWKLAAIDAYADTRALAWIDDAFDASCHAWAEQRPAPTLLVQTAPAYGLTSTEAQQLTEWAQALLIA
jgi:HAD domain in Swiss Army Knife RNA repair proteins